MHDPAEIPTKTLPHDLACLLSAKVLKAKARYGLNPMPLAKLRELRLDVGRHVQCLDPLLGIMPGKVSDASGLADPLLRELLSGQELGQWSLAVESLNYLEAVVKSLKPARVLEIGSGTSTMALRVYLDKYLDPGRQGDIISVEQNVAYMTETRKRLVDSGLDRGVQLVHAPVCEVKEQGRTLARCDLACLERAMEQTGPGLEKPSLVLVDGPQGPPGSRALVLPALKHLIAPGAVFLLDDALRDGEIWAAEQWDQDPDIEVAGLVWVGKGFLRGRIKG